MVDYSQDEAQAADLPESIRRSTGCYLTPDPVADLMARMLCGGPTRKQTFLDPAAGTGRLLAAAARANTGSGGQGGAYYGVEIQPALEEWCRGRLAAENNVIGLGNGLDLIEESYANELLGRATFDAIIANPPYVREKSHRDVFASLRAHPRWSQILRPRQDLQQLFLYLATELLADQGELVFLLNSYWLTNDAGTGVRSALSRRLRILTLIDFADYTLFADAPGQHNLIIHARRGGEQSETRFMVIDSARAPSIETVCDDLQRVFETGDDCSPPPYLGLSRAPALVSSGPSQRWYIPGPHDRALMALENTGLTLGDVFHTHQGMVSGADKVTKRNRTHASLEASVGSGIFLLSAEEIAGLDLNPSELARVSKVIRARGISPFEVVDSEMYVLRMDRGVDLAQLPNIAAHLTPFKELLSMRREVRTGAIPWFELHWPREPGVWERPRLLTPRRSTTVRFALSGAGFCEQSDVAMITSSADNQEALRALAVILNSRTLEQWCLNRGKQKGKVREYFGRSLSEIPLPIAVREPGSDFLALSRYYGRRTPESDEAVLDLYMAI